MLFAALFFAAAACGADEQEESAQIRLVNGYVINGKLQQATPDGLVVQTPKGNVTYQWKHLSAGTRERYEAAGKAATPIKPAGK